MGLYYSFLVRQDSDRPLLGKRLTGKHTAESKMFLLIVLLKILRLVVVPLLLLLFLLNILSVTRPKEVNRALCNG